MNAILAAAAENASEPGVQETIINSSGAIIGLGGVLLAAAWVAYLYR
jgi:hypothetical protein